MITITDFEVGDKVRRVDFSEGSDDVLEGTVEGINYFYDDVGNIREDMGEINVRLSKDYYESFLKGDVYEASFSYARDGWEILSGSNCSDSKHPRIKTKFLEGFQL